MGGKCRPGAWLVQGSPRPCAPLNVQCPSSPATSTPHPSCIAVCDGSVIDPRQTINCNANANAAGFHQAYRGPRAELPDWVLREPEALFEHFRDLLDPPPPSPPPTRSQTRPQPPRTDPEKRRAGGRADMGRAEGRPPWTGVPPSRPRRVATPLGDGGGAGAGRRRQTRQRRYRSPRRPPTSPSLPPHPLPCTPTLRYAHAWMHRLRLRRS